MIYRQKSKKGTFGLKIVIGLVVLLLILRFFGVNFTDGMLKNTFNYVLESKSSFLAPVRGTLVYFKSKRSLENDLKQLQAQYTDARLDLLTNQALSQEFENFKLHYGQVASSTRPLKVILRPPFMPFDTIRLSGDLSAYVVDNPVFYKNVIVGKLVEKTGRYGSVKLFSTPGEVTPATIKGRQFEAKGLGGGRYSIDAPMDFEVAEGDPVLYPNEQIILLGVVGQIESSEEDLFKKIYFNLPVALDEMSYVTIGVQPVQPLILSDQEEQDTGTSTDEVVSDNQQNDDESEPAQ